MINLNNGVANIKGTPGIITDNIANVLPSTVAIGTLLINNVDGNIYQSDGTTWNQLSSAGSQDLQHTLNNGNQADNIAIILYDMVTGVKLSLTAVFLQYLDVNSGFQQYLYPSTTFNNQKAYLPAFDGILATTQGFFKSQITTTPFTIQGGNSQNIYRISTGASTLTLNPANWIDRVTVTFLFDVTATFVAAGGATLKGQAFINSTGLVYVMYLSVSNTFYISHI